MNIWAIKGTDSLVLTVFLRRKFVEWAFGDYLIPDTEKQKSAPKAERHEKG